MTKIEGVVLNNNPEGLFQPDNKLQQTDGVHTIDLHQRRIRIDRLWWQVQKEPLDNHLLQFCFNLLRIHISAIL